MVFGNEAHKFKYETVSRILECPVSDHGKPLAGRSPKHTVNPPCAYAGCQSYVCRLQIHNRTAKDRGFWKIELMRGTMHRINFHSYRNIEPGLLEAQTEPACTCKKVDCYRPWHFHTPEQIKNSTNATLLVAQDIANSIRGTWRSSRQACPFPGFGIAKRS